MALGAAVNCSASIVNLTPPQSGCLDSAPVLDDPAGGMFGLKAGSPGVGATTSGADMGYNSGYEDLSPQYCLYPFAYAQLAVLRQALAKCFQNDDLPYDAVLVALGPIQNGLELLRNGVETNRAITYLRQVYQYLLLAFLFDLDAQLIELLFKDPSQLSLSQTSKPWRATLADLRVLARFADFRKKNPDEGGALLASRRAAAANPASDTVAGIASVLDWKPDDLAALLQARNPQAAGPGTAQGPLLDLGAILATKEVIDLANESGVDVPLLLQLYRQGLVLGAGGAESLLAAVAAGDRDAGAALRLEISDLKRHQLKRFAIPQLNALAGPNGPSIQTDSDLSDYLLIDVNMGRQTSTSRIVQATLRPRARINCPSSVNRFN